MKPRSRRSRILAKNIELLKEIITKYGATGIVNWKLAFQENPSWKTTLLGRSRKMQPLHAYVSLLRRKNLIDAPPARRSTRRVARKASTTQDEGQPLMVNFCPNCQCNILAVNTSMYLESNGLPKS